MAMAEMEDVPLVSEEKIPSNRRRLMMVVGAITFLMAMTLSITLGYVYFHKQHFRIRAGDPSHTKVGFPNQKDVQKLLELLQETYPDPQIVFNELKSLNVDNSDPENIKFTPKDWKPSNVTQKSQQLRSRRLQDCNEHPLPDHRMRVSVPKGSPTAGLLCPNGVPESGAVGLSGLLHRGHGVGVWSRVQSQCRMFLGCYRFAHEFLSGSIGWCWHEAELPSSWRLQRPGTTPAPEVEVDTDPVTRTFGVSVQDDIEGFLKRLRERQQAAQRERTERFKLNSAVGAGSRRLDEIANLPAMPLMKQEMDSEADAEYIQKRAQETIDSFLGGKDIDIKDKAAVKRQLKLTSEEVIQLKKDSDEKKWKAAVMMAFAVKDCSVENFQDKGQAGKNKCAVDITAAIASAGIAASLITISVINCPASLEFTEIMGKRFCAASIIDLVVATSYIGTSIASIQGTCGVLDNAWE